MSEAPVVRPEDREGPSAQPTGALPTTLYVIGCLSAIVGVLVWLYGLTLPGAMGSFEAASGASAFIGGILMYAAGDVVRSLRIISGRFNRG